MTLQKNKSLSDNQDCASIKLLRAQQLFPGCTKAYYTSPALFRITFIFQLTVFFSTTILVASKDTTTVPLGKSASLAPGLVSPLHITLAPLKRNLIAPLSTCCWGRIKGSKIKWIKCNVRYTNLWDLKLTRGSYLQNVPTIKLDALNTMYVVINDSLVLQLHDCTVTKNCQNKRDHLLKDWLALIHLSSIS